jgi:acetylornithine deacetylase
LRLERRTIPGESAAALVAELDALCARVARAHPTFRADVAPHTIQPPNDVAADAPIVQALAGALRSRGQAETTEGLSCWTDAALLTAAGIPAVCFGPGDIARAHGAEEWVSVAEIEVATDVLESVCAGWGRS